MLMQNLGVTNKEHYGMLRYFLESSIATHDSVIDSRSEWFRLSDLFSHFLCKGFHYLTNLVLFTLQLKKMK